MTHIPASCDLFHDRDTDVTEARHPTAGQRQAMDLMDIDPGHHPLVRLSLADWRRVTRIAAAIARP